jgi:putative Mg2+ transporter-C (MgtC) family protein
MGDVGLQLEVFREVVIALLLGGLIGLEREVADKPAGFRTQMMVSGAAALLVGLSDALLASFDAESSSGVIRSDPIRIVEAIITGVSFLGAGTIFRRGRSDHVEGLTTAASLLMSAAVGISVALNQIPLAVGVTALSLLVLWALRRVERRLRPNGGPRS